jgi:hypothetical protein
VVDNWGARFSHRRREMTSAQVYPVHIEFLRQAGRGSRALRVAFDWPLQAAANRPPIAPASAATEGRAPRRFAKYWRLRRRDGVLEWAALLVWLAIAFRLVGSTGISRAGLFDDLAVVSGGLVLYALLEHVSPRLRAAVLFAVGFGLITAYASTLLFFRFYQSYIRVGTLAMTGAVGGGVSSTSRSSRRRSDRMRSPTAQPGQRPLGAVGAVTPFAVSWSVPWRMCGTLASPRPAESFVGWTTTR